LDFYLKCNRETLFLLIVFIQMRGLVLLILFFLVTTRLQLSAQGSLSQVQTSVVESTSYNYKVTDNFLQRDTIPLSIGEYVSSTRSLPYEKIYLHLDRTGYLTGDTIWFKAYSWYGYEQIPDTLSKIMYVDLLDEGGKTRFTRKLLIDNGISEGDFCIDTTIGPGRYLIRAYTRWMQNLNTGDPFYQNITIRSAGENFQIECTPLILKNSEGDSLRVSFRFLEMDPEGNLKDSYTHKMKFRFRIGDQLLDSGQVNAVNTREEVFRSDLQGIDKKAAMAVFELSIDDKRVSVNKQFEIPLRDDIDIQFFPEGGTFIGGIQSRVAFKAIGPDGLSRNVKGFIETKEGDVITGFESLHKGMGDFLLKPETGREYFAHLLYNNRNYLIPLPHASEQGCSMIVSSLLNDYNRYLTIKCSTSEINSYKYVTGSTNGKIWFSALCKITKDSSSFRIPDELLPEGICRLTVLSADFTPESERLLYVDRNERIKIDIQPDSSSYGNRSKVTLMINTTGLDGTPVKANLSVAVVDIEQTTRDATINGISTYKLLESELRGIIEDAGYYFKDVNCTDFKMLDLLLLTQGYRKFKASDTSFNGIKFQPETGLNVSGNLVLNGNRARSGKFNYRTVDMTFVCQAGVTFLGQSHPDSLGRFSLQIPLLSGKPLSILQASTSRGKKFNGEIYLDNGFYPPEFAVPAISELITTTTSIQNVRQLQSYIKTEISKDPTAGFMKGNLPEIVVTAKAKNWYLDFEKEALKVIDLDTIDPQGDKFESVYDLLIRDFGAREIILTGRGGDGSKTILLPCVSVLGPNEYFPIYVINGYAWLTAAEPRDVFLAGLSRISYMHVNEINKLMVLPPGDISWFYADKRLAMDIQQSVVVIETYNKGYRGDPQGIKTFILEGLDSPRQFYSPRYDKSSVKNPAYDGRTTLLWNPSVTTDSSGQAKIDFYTSDRNTTFEVIINGMKIGNGAPGNNEIQIRSTLTNYNKTSLNIK